MGTTKKLNYLFYFAISLMFTSCCGGPITTNITKIESIEIISDSIVLTDKNFEFDLNPIDTILSTSVDDSDNCSEGEVHNDPIHTVVNVQVYTLTSFSNQFLANSEINELISVKFFNSDKDRIETIKLNEWLKYVNSRSTNKAKMAGFYNASTFTINQRPEIGLKQQFLFVFTLSDNTKLKTTSNVITWK